MPDSPSPGRVFFPGHRQKNLNCRCVPRVPLSPELSPGFPFTRGPSTSGTVLATDGPGGLLLPVAGPGRPEESDGPSSGAVGSTPATGGSFGDAHVLGKSPGAGTGPGGSGHQSHPREPAAGQLPAGLGRP